MKCFTNAAFGERLADLSHLLTGRNFTETLFRRSYITWFWKQPGNDPLKEEVWEVRGVLLAFPQGVLQEKRPPEEAVALREPERRGRRR
jgi:hypothetical protein